jgi:hypothetical protein
MTNENEQKEADGNLEDRVQIIVLKPHSNGRDKIIMGTYNGIEFSYLTKNGLFTAFSEGIPEKESAVLLDYLKSKYNPKPETTA